MHNAFRRCECHQHNIIIHILSKQFNASVPDSTFVRTRNGVLKYQTEGLQYYIKSVQDFALLCFLLIVSSVPSGILLLQWRHNGRDSVSNHQPHDCIINRLFRRRSKKTPKLCVTGLCAGNSPGIGEFPAQMASNEENVSIWWRHQVIHSPIFFMVVSLTLVWLLQC